MKDPICGMMVDERRARFKSEHRGRTFYFCSPMCKGVFDREPEKYARAM